MPLIKRSSKKALEKNIETEMEAHPGKEKRAQNIAIAYNIQKQARKKKMADGGEAEQLPAFSSGAAEEAMEQMKQRHEDMMEHNKEVDESSDSTIEAAQKHRYADGGEISAIDEHEANADDARDEREFHMQKVSDRVYDKMKRKRMADGGQVDIQDNGMEDPELYSHLNEEAVKKELYDDSQLDAQPLDSNEHGHEIDSDKHDHIDRIRLRIKQRRGF